MFWLFVLPLLMLSVLTHSPYAFCERRIDKGRTQTNNVVARKTLLVKKGFAEFREVVKKTVDVEYDLVDLPDVKECFDREFTAKKKEFTPQDLTMRAVVNLATIWCSYCRSINRCSCIRRFCFNVGC
ncbi:uncharacterized protein LOC127832367 [Dreissena polymorpha]|uniref:uncharacterized protein LOC127832367 n=1 Tax=Dreissena polymorpha TaxID=45954 RepID=UPI002264F50A|nr:uncharacterized protein LOC127832367 [Dreissena polymorpha]